MNIESDTADMAKRLLTTYNNGWQLDVVQQSTDYRVTPLASHTNVSVNSLDRARVRVAILIRKSVEQGLVECLVN